MSEQNGSNYTKGFLLGAIIGGAVGAITALLLAPKSGRELREDLAVRSSELYDKATDYFNDLEGNVSTAVTNTMNEGKAKAQNIISSAKRQAETILQNAERVLFDAKTKAEQTKDLVQDKIEHLREAAKASAEAFKTEMKSPLEEEKGL
ncbi:MAG TPA: YtxH domain-containing protein [Candidatus Kapabacteria bacterium]|nr:YtxH domain-containing protein [Candidatus Kapabacteria bacterium]HPO63087.1 YtxH domain-containing protein [Candidatus Kapabacteria bacterium]